jgi:hypothetical protein
MTEPIKLPPIPDKIVGWYTTHRPDVEAWGRLAVEQNTAELRAEVERLRANRDFWHQACLQAQEHRDGANASNAVWEAETVKLRAEVERLRADAERYRWLRGNQDDLVVGTHPDIANLGMTGVIGTYLEWIGGAEMDAAIDAALKEPK